MHLFVRVLAFLQASSILSRLLLAYAYVTTNQQGQVMTVTDVFTPSFPKADTPPTLSTGSVLQYTDWLTMVGTNTVPPKQAARNAGSTRTASFASTWLGTCFVAVGGMACGMWLVLV